MRSLIISGAWVGSVLLSGCASIVTGSSQVISVEAASRDGKVIGASCELKNPKGTFFISTPGTVTVQRAYDDLNIRCEKTGHEPGLATVRSSTKAMAFGNILFGGVIGAAVDANSGAAYDYPTLITVMMGGSTVIPQAAQPQAAVPAQAPVAPAANQSAHR